MKLLFGKHKDKDFEAVYKDDPKYCKWILSRYQAVEDKSEVTKSFEAFAEYISSQDMLKTIKGEKEE